VRPGVKKIFYCHTPVRHAYDLRDYYLSHMPWWKRLVFRPLTYLSKLVYNYGFRQMDVVIANSKNVQQRIKRYLKADSTIIYPPIQIDKFKWLGQQDYYLSFARVDRLKRVGDIVRAFQRMPDKKLIVCSGGDDLENIKQLANGYKNIIVKGWVSDDELKRLAGHCIASLYIPINEDFGMTPLESMSAGKPCIGVDEGGLKETIIDGQTGKFIPADYTLDDIIQAVNWLTPQRALTMRQACERQAAEFSVEKFIQHIQKII
jgi:glycosyltransferase involved in cell wall biosynthesis